MSVKLTFVESLKILEASFPVVRGTKSNVAQYQPPTGDEAGKKA